MGGKRREGGEKGKGKQGRKEKEEGQEGPASADNPGYDPRKATVRSDEASSAARELRVEGGSCSEEGRGSGNRLDWEDHVSLKHGGCRIQAGEGLLQLWGGCFVEREQSEVGLGYRQSRQGAEQHPDGRVVKVRQTAPLFTLWCRAGIPI